jgi:hypothetical protein
VGGHRPVEDVLRVRASELADADVDGRRQMGSAEAGDRRKSCTICGPCFRSGSVTLCPCLTKERDDVNSVFPKRQLTPSSDSSQVHGLELECTGRGTAMDAGVNVIVAPECRLRAAEFCRCPSATALRVPAALQLIGAGNKDIFRSSHEFFTFKITSHFYRGLTYSFTVLPP